MYDVIVLLLRLNRMLNYALCLSYHYNTEAVLFACLSLIFQLFNYWLPEKHQTPLQAYCNSLHVYSDNIIIKGFRSSFICQGTSTRRQRSDLCGHRVQLSPATTSLTTQRSRQSR